MPGTVAYCGPDDVRRALVRDLTRTTGTAASLGDDELAEHIATAQADVDASLAAGGYPLPLPLVPELVGRVAVAMAAWHADLSYRQGKGHDNQFVPVLQRYGWARALLEGWATGRRAVPGLEQSDAGGEGGAMGEPVNTYEGSLFGGPPGPVPSGASWADREPLYDPDAYRWGESRGWL